MDFQKLLLDVGKVLGQDDVKAFVFLCSDLLDRNLTSVKSASDLFSYLSDEDLLSAEQPHLLTELLLIIQRTRLVRDLRLPLDSSGNQISSYRKLLYKVSEDLTEENLRDMKFLLNGKLPRKKLEENVTALEVFQEMEHMDLINETNLNLLERLLQSCCPVSIDKIKRFQQQQAAPHSGPVAQETGRPRSVSEPFQPYQGLGSLQPEGGFSEHRPIAQSAMTSSNTSLDANAPRGGNECQSLSHALSGLSTKSTDCSSSKVRTSETEQPQMNRNFNKQSTGTTDNEVSENYPMTAAKRGFCLIINNHDFKNSRKPLLDREGTKLDQESLSKVFGWLGFELEIEEDCTREKILSVVQELGSRDHSDRDCLVCCILSHGDEECVYGVDGLTVSLKELKKPFTGLHCPSLLNKPKLFFIQACQGTCNQEAVHIQSDGPAEGTIMSDARRDSIPSDADFLFAMATVPSYVSYRVRSYGTWFIQSLCQNLVQMVPRRKSLMSILTKVNGDVSEKTDHTGQKKQMPQPAFTLRKKVVFPKPQAAPPSLYGD